MTAQPIQPYDEAFYQQMAGGSGLSAELVVPIVLNSLHPRSVIDVGCGVGTWAAAFLAGGVDDTWGVDGSYVDPAMLKIPRDRFLARDLSEPVRLDRTYDLAVSLEVAEHLPVERAETFVEDLTKLSSSVLFSAAIPHQGGTDHRNERWPSYWARIFEKFGYYPSDFLRGQIWADERIEFWYRQNTLLFSKTPLSSAAGKPVPASPLDIVHPSLYIRNIEYTPGLRLLLAQLPGAFYRALHRRIV